MMSLFITLIISFIVLLILVKRLNFLRIGGIPTILDGLFFGSIFFILLPIIYSFLVGEIEITNIPEFSPHRDSDLLIYCLLSILFFGVLTLTPKNNRITKNSEDFIDQRIQGLFILILVLYVLSILLTFFASGKLSGNSHWYRGNAQVFEKGAIYVLLGQLHNVGRVAIPGLCIYFQLKYLQKDKIFKPHFFLAFVIIVLELFMAGNRIVILFFAFSFLIPFFLFKRFKILISMALISLPMMVLAEIWPMARGLMFTEKVTVERVAEVISIAYEKGQSADNDSDLFLILTEGSNIAALKFIKDKYPKNKSFSYGETLILKSFGALIPKSIWPNKPDGVGHEAGEAAIGGVSLILNVTILGDAWANFGWFGIIYIGMILILINKLIPTRYLEFISPIFFMTSIAAWRFDFSFYFITIYILIFYLSIIKVPLVKYYSNKMAFKLFN